MGFPIGYHDIQIPAVLVNLEFGLAHITNGMCCLLSWLGLADLPQPDRFSWQEYSEMSYQCVPESIRKNLPVLTFRCFAERFGEMEEDVMCAICLSSFGEDDQIRELCNCCHIFHRDCLDKWIDHSQKTCPLCRCRLFPPTNSVDTEQEGEGNDELWVVDRISYLFGEDLIDDFSV